VIHFVAPISFESMNSVYEHECVGTIVGMNFSLYEFCAYGGVWLHVNYILKIAAL